MAVRLRKGMKDKKRDQGMKIKKELFSARV
jgi:hypothetical protein